MDQFGAKLRKLRQQHNMTLQQLASELGIKSHSYVSALESSKKQPSVEHVLKIAQLFGVTTDQLVRDELDVP